MKTLVLDNYDSFTYNLVHILRALEIDAVVKRNDQIGLDEVNAFDKILLSPGPGLPSEAGIMPQLIDRYKSNKSILGVCLGHQAIGECFGAKLFNLPTVFHGIVTETHLENQDQLFHGVPNTFQACRYHSWVIADDQLPDDLTITSRDANGTIMSVKHKQYDVRGVQFHPESIMSEHGKTIIANWLKI